MLDGPDRHGELDLAALAVPGIGSVFSTGLPDLPWVLLDADGAPMASVSAWLTELNASDYAPSTLRSYAYDLLGWHRFLAAIDIPWQRATRIEVRDWVRWRRVSPNPQRRRTATAVASTGTVADRGTGRPAAGSVNERTGKPYLQPGYSATSINHGLAVVSGFYDYAVDNDLGPLVNPVPRVRSDRRDRRPRHDLGQRGPRAPYRQRTVTRFPKQLPDELFNELFAGLRSNRDRAIVATAVSSGARASELLSMRRVDLHIGEQTIDVIAKGGRGRSPMRAGPDAFMWMALHLAERPAASAQEPVWMTGRGPLRPLTYSALRQVLERANTSLGTNITMHDLRHTYCYRLMQDPNLLITEVQELMRHRSLASTQIYMRARMDELVVKLQEHYARAPAPPPTPAAGYAAADLQVLFPGAIG